MTTLAVQRPRPAERGLTLIELVIALVVVAILTSIALPGYRKYVQRAAREAAQAQLMELVGLQEKIFLNSNAYTDKVSSAYDGSSSGGLGVTGGTSRDGRYTISATVDGASFTLEATPVAGGTQAGDGVLKVSSEGTRTWGSKPW